MTFEEFKSNVEAWAEARGIYEHSTALAQALKAVSEVGELADAVIKGDREALKDAIADVAVCLVNVARMEGVKLDGEKSTARAARATARATARGGLGNSTHEIAAYVSFCIGDLASEIAYFGSARRAALEDAMTPLKRLAVGYDLSFEECCAAAWPEIKDRKGRMVPVGAFVKEADA